MTAPIYTLFNELQNSLLGKSALLRPRYRVQSEGTPYRAADDGLCLEAC